jgi:hypothetical protein
MTDFAALMAVLAQHEVEFIVAGGAAAIAHGSARLTQDLDIVYQRSPENIDRLIAALGRPQSLPARRRSRTTVCMGLCTLARGLNFTLVTSLGDIDLPGEIPGGGTYDDLAPDAIELQVFGTHCLCLSLPQLIRAKRAAGRPRDMEALAELEAIEEEQP